jgi:hypothetical protein
MAQPPSDDPRRLGNAAKPVMLPEGGHLGRTAGMNVDRAAGYAGASGDYSRDAAPSDVRNAGLGGPIPGFGETNYDRLPGGFRGLSELDRDPGFRMGTGRTDVGSSGSFGAPTGVIGEGSNIPSNADITGPTQ